MSKGKRSIFKIIIVTVAFLALSLIMVYTYMYITERPGGLADQTMSKPWD